MDEMLNEILPDDWCGDSETLTCPCGHLIEWDGECPDGCVSPLKKMGMI
jgi:hypothetical protein